MSSRRENSASDGECVPACEVAKTRKRARAAVSWVPVPEPMADVMCAGVAAMPVVQVKPGGKAAPCVTATRDTWKSMSNAFRKLCGSSRYLGAGIVPLSPSESQETLATLYGLVEDATLACEDGVCSVYRVSWEAAGEGDDPQPHHADFVVDDTDGGSGVGFVYRTGCVFVKGPCTGAEDGVRASAVTTDGQVDEISPAALCYLQLFCDLVRTVTAKRARQPHWLAMDVTVNTAMDADVLAVQYRRHARDFSAAVLALLYDPPCKKAPVADVAAAASRSAADQAALMAALSQLADTLRRLGLSRAEIRSQAAVWKAVGGAGTLPGKVAADFVLGCPSSHDGVESAIYDLARSVLSSAYWTSDLVQDQEAVFLACASASHRVRGNTSV